MNVQHLEDTQVKVFDTGASRHCVNLESKCDSSTVRMLSRAWRFGGADGKANMEAIKCGDLTLQGCRRCGDNLFLKNVFIIDNLSEDLISGPTLAKEGYVQIAWGKELWIYKSVNGKLVPVIGFTLVNGRYVLKGDCEKGQCKRPIYICNSNCTDKVLRRVCEESIGESRGMSSALEDCAEMINLHEKGYDVYEEYGISSTEELEEQVERLTPMQPIVGGVTGTKLHNRFHMQSLDYKQYLEMVRGLSGKEKKKILQQREAAAGRMCEFCIVTKMSKEKLRKKTSERSKVPGEVLNIDMKLFDAPTIHNEWYYLVGVDEATSYHMVELLKKKNDARAIMEAWFQFVKTQQGRPVKKVRTDNAPELSGKEVRKAFMNNYGIVVVTSPPYMQRHNGIAEAGVKLSDTLAMVYLRQSGLGSKFRGYATKYAVKIINLMPAPARATTREELWSKSGKPTISRARAFGCLGMAYTHTEGKGVNEEKGKLAVYLGFGNEDHEFYMVMLVHSGNIRMVGNFITDEKLFYRHLKKAQEDGIPESLTEVQEKVASQENDIIDEFEYYDSEEADCVVESEADGDGIADSEAAVSTTSQGGERHDDIHDGEDVYEKTTPEVSDAIDNATHFRNIGYKKYEIEDVIEARTNSEGQPIVCVKWTGYDDCTWEPRAEIEKAAPKLVQAAVDRMEDANNKEEQESEECATEEEHEVKKMLRIQDDLEEHGRLFLVKHLIGEEIPKSYADIMKLPQEKRKSWMVAVYCEYRACVDNEVFKFVPHCNGKKPVPTKDVANVKITELPDGTFEEERKKFRLVGKGLFQKPHIDYDIQNYSPTMGDKSAKLLVATAIRMRKILHGFDFSSAYLQALITHEIYIEVPPGFIDYLFMNIEEESVDIKRKKQLLRREYLQAKKESKDGKVYIRLRKALPGLVQSAKEWNNHLHKWLRKRGFKSTGPDRCVYVRKWKDEKSDDTKTQVLGIFVDDGQAFGDDIESLQPELEQAFNLRWLNELNTMLGVHYTWKVENGMVRAVTLDQRAYILKMAEVFEKELEGVRPHSTPMEPRQVLMSDGENEDDELIDESIPYRSVVGSLLFLSRLTAPTLHFAVTQACRFSSAPRKSHWKAAIQILKYAIDNKDKLTITYDNTVEYKGMYAFSDSEFATQDPETRRSFCGWVIYFCGGPVLWTIKQNKRATRGTAQTEYYALSMCADEVMTMRELLKWMGYDELLGEATTIFCDNRSAIGNANGTMNPKASKHVEMNYHIVRDYVENRDIKVVFIRTDAMIADIFTKSLVRMLFEQHGKVLRGGKAFDILMKLRSSDSDTLKLIGNKLYRVLIKLNGRKVQTIATI